MLRSALSLLVTLLLLAVPRAARAGDDAVSLTLVVANNKSGTLARPALHYADDDGAKYRALFRAGAEQSSDVVLLTRFDRDTSRLFAEVPDGPPTRDAIAKSVKILAARAADVRRGGRDVAFVFVFAGHGDVDRGKGFLELEDGAFSSDDLASLVGSVGATQSHVILDSCNSFFLVSPRSPGGRHVATSTDAVEALKARMPNVGVLLSTSADGEVFEWSEIGAGVFSHVVRSGLGGSADANRDGRVTYAELRAFVTVSTSDIRNPRYRPKLFARGPSGDDDATLFAPRKAKGRHVTVQGGERVTLRDADEVPWLDVHAEEQTALEILVPAPLERGGVQEVLDPNESTRVLRRTSFDGSTPTDPDDESERVAARGRDDLFGTLFRQPFGPRAFAAAAPASSEEQLYGVSANDVTRFHSLLQEVESTDRARRNLGTIFGGVTSVASLGAGTFLIAMHDDATSKSFGFTYVSAGIAAGVSALVNGFRSLPSEKLRMEFEADLATSSKAEAMERTEAKLEALARKERRNRIIGSVCLGVLTAATAAYFVGNELQSQPRLDLRSALLTNLTMLIAISPILYAPTPIERLANTWRQDPSRATSRVALSPVGPGGPGLSLVGTF